MSLFIGVQTPLLNAFRGRSVFLTGHTGFKGSWLAIWLAELGAKVSGYSLSQATSPSNFETSSVREMLSAHHEADIRDASALKSAIDQAEPDVVLHLAAQPLVRESYRTPLETMETNVMGTCNVLEAIRLRNKPCTVVVVTSDKCYENREHVWGYRENDAMGGFDPYSASKGAAEVVAASYRRSFFAPDSLHRHGIKVASGRAGNVIGGGDWAQDRIVPDLVKSFAANRLVPLRNPLAVRPWQHVLEPLFGYLTLAARMLVSDDPKLCDGWNFGPTAEGTATVKDLVEAFAAEWGRGGWEDQSVPGQLHEANLLRLCIDKAVAHLNWRPTWNFQQTISHTARWYREYHELKLTETREACLRDITDFVAAASHAVDGSKTYSGLAA